MLEGVLGGQSSFQKRSASYWNCSADPHVASRGRAVPETQALKLARRRRERRGGRPLSVLPLPACRWAGRRARLPLCPGRSAAATARKDPGGPGPGRRGRLWGAGSAVCCSGFPPAGRLPALPAIVGLASVSVRRADGRRLGRWVLPAPGSSILCSRLGRFIPESPALCWPRRGSACFLWEGAFVEHHSG